MSYIPDCREDGAYSQKNLNKKDKEFINGFDYCTQMAVDNFFDNEFGNLLLDSDYLKNMLEKELPEGLKDEYQMEISYPFYAPEEVDDRKVVTYGDLIRMKILEWIECTRNELITSMIENMGEKDHAEEEEGQQL